MDSQRKVVKYDEIKKILQLPSLRGIRFDSNLFYEHSDKFRLTLPLNAPFEEEEMLGSIPRHLLRTNNGESGDHARDFKPVPSAPAEDPEPQVAEPTGTAYLDLLSGYDEYLRDFYSNRQTSSLRITPQGTLSLSLGYNMLVDVSLNGAIRIINPNAHIALALNHDDSASAVMHPLGRLHHEGATAQLMTFDMHKQVHKFAKLWADRCVFKSSEMTFAYTMDSAGTRTTFSPMPLISSNDISLPVFYNASPHGPEARARAEAMGRTAKRCVDAQGNVVWSVNNITVKYMNGELRVIRAPNTHLRTSALTGCLALSTDKVHCTATQGHMFVKFGENKMHFDGGIFRMRTAGQAAGFDEENRIRLY